MKSLAKSAVVVVIATALVPVIGCDNQTPRTTEETTSAPAAVAASDDTTPADAGTADAAVTGDAGSAGGADACLACVGAAGNACEPSLEACKKTAKCEAFFACGVGRSCGRPGADQVSCLTPCAISAGITGMDDPAVAPFFALLTCSATSCTDACNAR